MNNLEIHNECKILSQAVYRNNLGKTIGGWECVKSKSYNNGYYVEVYKKDKKIIIVSRGTEIFSKKDLYNDYLLASGSLPSQIDSARGFVSQLKNDADFKKCEFIITGHSLGGSISQAIGAETGLKTVTFAAYGVGHINDKRFKYSDNIINYGSKYDGIFMNNIDNQIGKTMILLSKPSTYEYAKKEYTAPNINFGKKYMHKIENIGDLSIGIEYKKSDNNIFNNNIDAPLFKIEVQKNKDDIDDSISLNTGSMRGRYSRNIDNFDTVSDKIFTPENRVFYDGEINPAKIGKNDDLYEYVPKYLEQYWEKDFKLPREEELKQKVKTGELICVHDYVRSDGTKVSGYYRHQG